MNKSERDLDVRREDGSTTCVKNVKWREHPKIISIFRTTRERKRPEKCCVLEQVLKQWNYWEIKILKAQSRDKSPDERTVVAGLKNRKNKALQPYLNLEQKHKTGYMRMEDKVTWGEVTRDSQLSTRFYWWSCWANPTKKRMGTVYTALHPEFIRGKCNEKPSPVLLRNPTAPPTVSSSIVLIMYNKRANGVINVHRKKGKDNPTSRDVQWGPEHEVII